MPGKHWTNVEDALLMELAGDGSTDAECAAELNRQFETSRTASGVRKRRAEIGVKMLQQSGPRPNELLRSQLLTLLQCGMKLNRIASKLGKNVTSVLRMVKKLEDQGLVRRMGGSTSNCRYVVTLAWIRD